MSGRSYDRVYSRTRTEICNAIALTLIAVLMLIGQGTRAQAQDVDWLLEVSDDGFEDSPALSTIEYTFEVINNGFGPAPTTTLEFDVPSNTSFVGTLATSGPQITNCSPATASAGQTVICEVPTLTAFDNNLANLGDTASVIVQIETVQQGVVTIDAAVGDAGVDPDTGNNTVRENTTIRAGSDVALALNLPSDAASGELVTFDWQVTNNGPNNALSVFFEFPVPTGISNVSSIPSGCSLAGPNYLCTINNVPVGDTISLPFEGQVGAGGGSTITATASVTGSVPVDVIDSNNTATGSIDIDGGTDVFVGLSSSQIGTVTVGTPVDFTISTGYTGDNPEDLVVTTTIPDNYQIDNIVSPPGWNCEVAVGTQDVTCTRAAGTGAGTNIDLGDILIETTAVTAGTGINVSAEISSSGPPESNGKNNTAAIGPLAIEASNVDLRANKAGPNPPLAVLGQNISFRLSTTNVGTEPFVGTIELTDDLPAGLEVTNIGLNGWTCSPTPLVVGPQQIECTRVYTAAAPLAPGQRTPQIILLANVTSSDPITNTVTVNSPDSTIADANPANDTTSFTLNPDGATAGADVSVAKTAALPALAAGAVQTFTIEVRNDGPTTAEDIVVRDNITGLINNIVGPDGGYVGETVTVGVATGMTCSNVPTGSTSRRLQCDIATLPVCTAGVDCPVIEVQVRPGGEAGSRTNQVSAVALGSADPDRGNQLSTIGYNVTAQADVTVTKVGTPDPVAAGQVATFVITAVNPAESGLSTAENVTITDTLPANMTFVSATPSSGTCAVQPAALSVTGPGNNTVECNLGTLAPGVQSTVTVLARPNFGLRGTTITNPVVVSTTTPETDLTNNDAQAALAVSDPDVDILVNKDDDVDPVAIGQTVTYTIEVENLGPSASQNIVVTDVLPSTRVSFQSFTVSGAGACGTVPAVGSFGQTLECSFPLLLEDQSETVTVTLLAEEKGSTTNSVTISSDEIVAGFDREADNNLNSENTTIRSRGDLEVVSKVPSVNPVNVASPFDFTILLRNNTGPGLVEIDDVVLNDSLPTGMILAGAPTAVVTTGTTSLTSCSGASGDTSFSCNFGTMSSGGVVEITVPVRVTSVSVAGQGFTNTATATTSSLDVNPDNNDASGSVVVEASSIAGTVFRDFAADTTITAGDTGVAGVPIRLQGTAIDGSAIDVTVNTDASGNFFFDLLPEGTYSLTRGDVNEPNLVTAANTAGSEGGNTPSLTLIDTIALPGATDATDYLFSLVPTARVGLAKEATGLTEIQSDGSFRQVFTLTVENFSLEPLINVQVTDPLAGAAPLFGSFASVGNAATDALAAGSYTVVSSPSGSCGGLNGGFNGAGDQVVASGFTLGIGSTCTIAFEIRVQPTAPQPPVLPSGGRYENQATVTAEGGTSGQTPATNPELRDLSDDGTEPDTNGDGDGSDANENDPTPVNPVATSGIALVKSADVGGLSSPAVAGELISYSFAVTNTGNVTLTNVTVTDSLPGIVLSGSPIASLAPGETDSTSITATYALQTPDLNAGSVTNSAIATGTDPFGDDVTDTSGTTVDNDDPLVTSLMAEPAIALIKTSDASALSSPSEVGDVISYSFTVTNTGNVTLSNITLADTLAGLTLTGGPIASLAPGQSDATTFGGTYQITQDDIDAGEVVNLATVTGTPPTGPDVTDDSGSDNTTDAPTVTPIPQNPAITLDKVAETSFDTQQAVAGDLITYSFVITNTGNVTLTDVSLTDSLPGVVIIGGAIPTLAPGAVDDTRFTAEYVLQPSDITAGEVVNTATVEGAFGPDPAQTVTDDDTETTSLGGEIEALPEIFPPFETDGGTTTSMLASDTLNNQPATLDNVTITVLNSDPEVTLDPATGLITLSPGNPAGVYEVEYQITSIDDPSLTDTTTETVVQLPLPGIEATKTQELTDNGDGQTGLGDTITYTITVENLGNVALVDVEVIDTITDVNGAALSLTSGPDYVSATLGSPEGELQIGETATYTATYVIDAQAVAAGGVENQVTAQGTVLVPPDFPASPVLIADDSDDGDDTDGNDNNDPTTILISPTVDMTGLTLTKTTPLVTVSRGDTVPYTITVENQSAVVAGPFDLVDTLPPGFIYVPGSSSLPGEILTGSRRITWPNVTIPANGTLTVSLSARILNGAQSGNHVNLADLIDPATGLPVVAQAEAVVRIEPEPVFDCADVIGKVFEDHNGNGYQDPGRTGAITDQTYSGGKGGKFERPRDLTERGIPGVRLATVDGTIITTDQNGLYSVPCAMLPADRGSNFILKLDERTLPAGFRMTTENPRVVRLTPGMLTEMNFGASIGKVVRIDLGDAAFTSDGLAPGLVAGIDGLLPQIAGEVVTLRLAYHVAASADQAAVKSARQRMRTVDKYLKRQWRKVGRTRLTVEQTIVRTR